MPRAPQPSGPLSGLTDLCEGDLQADVHTMRLLHLNGRHAERTARHAGRVMNSARTSMGWKTDD